MLIVAAGLGVALGRYIGKGFIPPAAPVAVQSTRLPVKESRDSQLPRLRHYHGRDSEHTSRGAAEPEAGEPSASETEKQTSPLPAPQPRMPRTRGLPGELSCARGEGTKIALTLDAGASAAPTPRVLDALRAAGLKVTFFLTGKWCEQNPEMVRAIHAEGHEIANHTYSHPDLRKLTDEQIAEQISHTDEIVQRITGEPCAHYLRPPYGGRDRRVLRAVADQGYTTVYWSLDSWDAFKKGITSDEIKQRVLDRVQGGDIILMHCGSAATADALPSLIRELGKRGYRIVKVSELTSP